jgi:hypothetical protein
MSRTVDPVKLRLYKVSRLKGKSKELSLIDAGCSVNTAHAQNKCLRLDKVGDAEIKALFDKKQITVDFVLENIQEVRRLAKEKQDYATVLQCDIAIGKYLAMFTDKTQNKTEMLVTEKQTEINTEGNRLVQYLNSAKQ